MGTTVFQSLFTTLATLAALTIGAASAHAQNPDEADFPKVVIKTSKLADNFYTLEGTGPVPRGTFVEGGGVGTIGVLTGPEGVLMVDAMFGALHDKIVTAVKGVTDQPIRFLINTHVHGDHTNGNEGFARMGVVIFARTEVRDRLAHPVGPNGATRQPPPPPALPVVTYSGPVTFHLNGEDVDLIHVPRAHTDGDTFVRFRRADVIMAGDVYRSIQFPNIARDLGGSLDGLLDGLALLIGLAGPNTKIVPGHGPTVDRTAVVAHRDMIVAVRDRVARLIQQGKTQSEVIAAKPAADYAAKIPQTETNEDRFVGAVYADLKGGR